MSPPAIPVQLVAVTRSGDVQIPTMWQQKAPGRGNCRRRSDRAQELGQLYYQLVDQLSDQLYALFALAVRGLRLAVLRVGESDDGEGGSVRSAACSVPNATTGRGFTLRAFVPC